MDDATLVLGRGPLKIESSWSRTPTDRVRRFLDAYRMWLRKELTQAQAASSAQMSERTFRRLVRRYREAGNDGLADRRLRPSPRRASHEEVIALEELYAAKYRSLSVRRFYREYQNAYDGTRSYTWVKNTLQQSGLVRKRPQNTSQQELVRQQATEGVLLHQCVCRFAWSAGQAWNLVVIIDDATHRVHSGFFVTEDTIWSRYRSIREVLLTRGHFDAIIPDRLEAFGNRRMFTQLVRAMEELEIMVMPVRSPEAQQRCNSILMTLKHCLPWRMAESRVTQLSDANKFLSQYWPRVNGLFVDEAKGVAAFSTLNPSIMDMLDNILCLKETSRIDKNYRIVYEDRIVKIPAQRQKAGYRDKKIRIHEYEDGRPAVYGVDS